MANSGSHLYFSSHACPEVNKEPKIERKARPKGDIVCEAAELYHRCKNVQKSLRDPH